METTWNDVLMQIASTLVGLITTVGVPYLLYLLKKQTENDLVKKMLDEAAAVVKDCVMLVNQTFVDSLKAEGKFDAEAQKEAFLLCKDEVLKLLSDKAKQAIITSCGSLEDWVKTKIESNVYIAKKA